MNKLALFLFGFILICNSSKAQDSSNNVNDSQFSNTEIKSVDIETFKLIVRSVCEMVVLYERSWDEKDGYGEFSAFETQIMDYMSPQPIPYRTLSAKETRDLFSDFWNKYLIGEVREQNCQNSYVGKSKYTTGSVFRWLVVSGNEELFRRLTDQSKFSIDLEAKGLDGQTLEQWIKMNMKDRDPTDLKYKHYIKFKKILEENKSKSPE